MDIYNFLLEKYKDYLKRDEVEDGNETISAYTLWNLINEYIGKYQFYRDSNSGVVESVNNRYKREFQATFCSGTDLYDLATRNFDTRIPFFRPIKFIGMESSYANNYTTAVFEFILRTKVTDNKERVNESIKVYRDFGDDRYYGDHANDFLVYSCREQLDERVSFLERFAPCVKSITEGKCPSSQIIDNSTISISMNHSLIGKPSVSIKLNKTLDPRDSQYKQYSDAPYTIISLIEGKQDELLKRTPINLRDLNGFCRFLAKTYLDNKRRLAEKMKERAKTRMKLIDEVRKANNENK